jgi:hypothetical protein
MDRHSLLDYLADDDGSETVDATRKTAELLEHRLAELANRLATLRTEVPASPDQAFASQIETILRRRQQQAQPGRAAEPERQDRQPGRHYPRIEMQAPPLAADMPAPALSEERSLEFTKFVEAVHLIGQAANRFLQEPPRQAVVVHEPAGTSQDTQLLTTALKDTIAAFQAMTTDLVSAAGEIRRAAEIPKHETEREAPRRTMRDTPPIRDTSREDDEFFRLQDDLDDLRDRLGAMTRRRSRDRY